LTTQAGVRLSDLTTITRRLCERTLALDFGLPVTHVYQPLDYAWQPHSRYLERYGNAPREVLLLGMNPGPFGMAQTGIPFGDVGLVRDWLGIREAVERPDNEHPKRPVLGFDCPRSEVSGRRLWSWARTRFDAPERFFRRFFVWNYCPLSFMEASGRNRTPDKLPLGERRALFEVCDEALTAAVQHLRPRYVVGVGRFAAERAAIALGPTQTIIGTAPHPSPANPAANRGWEPIFEKALREIGIDPLP
jgi:single-strand selective monofunctional uracil DNA glycosylase